MFTQLKPYKLDTHFTSHGHLIYVKYDQADGKNVVPRLFASTDAVLFLLLPRLTLLSKWSEL